jgi:phage shock protein E
MRSARRTGTSPARALVVVVVLLLIGSACAADPPAPAPAPAPADASPARLLDAPSFEQTIADNPAAPVVNVHVPYEGHIPGTTDFVAYDGIGEWAGLPAERDRLLVLYCRSGNMSAQAARTLAGLGYTNLVDLEGGMHAWTASGRSLARDPAAATSG